jgi:hypothetical protein
MDKSDHLKRRSFLKNTALTIGAVTILGEGRGMANTATATAEPPQQPGSGSAQPQQQTTTVPVSAFMWRITTYNERMVRSDSSSSEWFVVESSTISASDENGGQTPPPPVPAAPAGFPVSLGWVEPPTANDVLTQIKNTLHCQCNASSCNYIHPKHQR